MQRCGEPQRAPRADAATGQLHPCHVRAVCAGSGRGKPCVAHTALRRMMLCDALLRRSADQKVSVFHMAFPHNMFLSTPSPILYHLYIL